MGPEKSTYDLLIEKWEPVLQAKEVSPIKDHYRLAQTAKILELQEQALETERTSMNFLGEAAHGNNISGGNIDTWDPILISLVRRSMPNLIAFDVASVQALSGPTGQIFAFKSKYATQDGTEALFNEADTDFSGTGIHGGKSSSLPTAGTASTITGDAGTTTSLIGAGTNDDVADDFGYGIGMSTEAGERLGMGGAGDGDFGKMAFSIDRVTAVAKTRALAADFTMELVQDLKAVHGLDAEAELANILSAEILAEINRETIRTINLKAKLGAQTANVVTKGYFDLASDSDGRWSAEKFKGLVLQLDLEANAISKLTRRGKGNFIICSSNVASALHLSGMLDYAPAMDTKLNEVDDTGNTFAGTLQGRIKVYIDPYAEDDYINVGYRGSSPYDAGLFYCPYVPLTMVRAMDPNAFQPKIGFKTRYAMVANPFAEDAPVADTGANRSNRYFRIFGVRNILS